MEKLVVEIFVPAVNKKYDILLPDNMKIGAVAILCARMISEQEQVMLQTDSLFLGTMDAKRILEDDMSVSAAGITDGSTLILL